MTTPTQPHPATPASAEAAYWMATLDPAQRPQMLNESMHDVGIRKKQVGEQFVAEQLDFYGWRYTLVPLFDHPPSAERGGDEQASFERWARRQSWFLDYMAESKKDGHYTDPDMRVAWEAWQWRAALAAQPTPEPSFAGIAARKLDDLKAQGYMVDGYSIQHAETKQRGFITSGGFVGWWVNKDHVQPTPEPVALQGRDEFQEWLEREQPAGCVADMERGWKAARASLPAGGVVEPTRSQIINALQYAWDDHCSDTGCYPDDFEVLPRKRLKFTAGRWADFVASCILAHVATPQPSETQGHRQMTDEQRRDLITNWFAEDWAIKKAHGLLDDYEAHHGIPASPQDGGEKA